MDKTLLKGIVFILLTTFMESTLKNCVHCNTHLELYKL